MPDHRLAKLCALAACIGVLLSSRAEAFDLNGAWTTSADQCSKIFVKKGNQISFAQFSEEFGGGFVADEKQIRGKIARCVIRSREEAGDAIELRAFCASDIMTSNIELHLKIVDQNTVSRVFSDPDMAGVEMSYSRCAM